MPEGYATHSWKPLREREHHTFLSHAHVNRTAVERINRWLQDCAGLRVWYDAEKMPAGQRFPSALAEGIGDSKSILIAVSKEAISREWVQSEASIGLAQRGYFKNFPVIPVRLEQCELPHELVAHSAVDAFDGSLTGPEAARLLRSIHGLPDLTAPAAVKEHVLQHVSTLAGDAPDPLTAAHTPVVYVTCGWRDNGNEALLRKLGCASFAKARSHLIGDAEDHPHTDKKRIRSIMAGCSAHLVILPKRADTLDDPAFKGIRSEIQFGHELGLPQWWIVERGLSFPRSDATAFLEVDLSPGGAGCERLESTLCDWADDLPEQCGPPKDPHFVFVATDYDDTVIKDDVMRHIAQITGLPCVKGSEFGRQIPSRKIEVALRNASLVIANVISATGPDGLPIINANTCIEAGVAMGAQRQLHIIARRAAKETWKLDEHLPFMIRHNTVETYADDQHLIGLVHRYARPFRRRVIGAHTFD